MEREEVEELQWITPIVNVPSVLRLGILSNRRAARVPHESVADAKIQERRSRVQVPGGRLLHEYANVYICARNPMLLKRSGQHQSLCVLRVSTAILDLPDVVICANNASSDYRRFAPAPRGLTLINRDRVFAEWWTHPNDQIEQWRHASEKCAEVLVPDRVPPQYILGAYVSCVQAMAALRGVAPELPVAIDTHLFFLGSSDD